tara:strand:- start:4685 stop:4930 length:246 start_codon:yes stop_codon:yes gene_type:complete
MENSYTKWRERQEELKEDIKQDAEAMLRYDLDELFVRIHNRYDTISGDISPEQDGKLESYIKNISELIAEQVYQNLPEVKH